MPNKPKRRTGSLPCTHCGVVFDLQYSTLRRAEKRGYYTCLQCVLKDPVYKAKHAEDLSKVLGTPEFFAAQSNAQRARYARDGTTSCSENAKKFYSDPKHAATAAAHRQKLSDKWKDPAYRAMQATARSTDEYKQKISASLVKAMNDPVVKARHKASVNTPETKLKLSATSLETWQKLLGFIHITDAVP